jgi:hypothetical protein
MAYGSIAAGSTSQSINVFIQNSSLTTGGGLTGFAPAGGSVLSGLTAYYSFTGINAGSVSITLSVPAAVTSAYSSGQLVEIDATNMPGWARFDLPNGMIATGKGQFVSLNFKGGTNVAQDPIVIELTGWNNQDAVHGGMSALPNTACTTNASLLTSGASTDQLSVSAGKVLLQATQTGVTIPTVTTVTNQLTAAAIATGLWQDTTSGDFTVASSIGKSLYTGGVVPGGTNGLFIAGTNAAVSITTALTANIIGNITGNLSGSVGSVTGAVTVTGTVTANVTEWLGTAVTAATAGVPDMNVLNFNNHACTTDANGYPGVNMVDIAGAALNTTLAQIGVNLVNTKGTASAGAAGYVGLDWSAINAPTTAQTLSGTTISTSQVIASVTGAVGSVTGAVGSVTGSVGSVVGNVGGNVVGSVGSVTGNVGGNVVGSVGSVTAVVSANVTEILGTASTGAPGYVGIDWSEINAPTSTQNLSGTTVHAVTVAGGDTPGTTTLLTRLPQAILFDGSGLVEANAEVVSDKTGYAVSSSGLDAVVTETGLNIRQATSLNTAALCGVLSGAGTSTVTIKGAGVGTTRIVASIDGSNNRTALTLTPPT